MGRGVPRVDDRRVLNGIFGVLRSGAPWRDLPERYGPRTTSYNRFVRWRKAGVWGRMMDAITAAYDGVIMNLPSAVYSSAWLLPANVCLSPRSGARAGIPEPSLSAITGREQPQQIAVPRAGPP